MEASEARLLRVAWLCLRSFDGVGQLLGFYLRRVAGLIAPFENADNASFYHAAVGSPLLRWLPDWAWLFPISALGVLLALATVRWRCLAPLAPVSVVLLVSNLLTAPLSRYRLPLVVLAMPFAGLALERTWRWVTRRRLGAVAGALAAIVALRAGAALAERRLVLTGPEPWMNVYRYTDFNVSATEYAEQERYDAASREYLALAAHSPLGSFQWVQALLLAALMQARAGDADGARASVRMASESAPAAARVWLAIGDVYRETLADPAGAAEAYRRAAELRPTEEVLEALRARTRDLKAHGGEVTPPRPVR
jgi:tetratricopeptide (TPR) repeat protein